jgi:hypothetical protein
MVLARIPEAGHACLVNSHPPAAAVAIEGRRVWSRGGLSVQRIAGRSYNFKNYLGWRKPLGFAFHNEMISMAKLLLGSVFVALSFFGTSLLLHNLGYRGGAFGIGIVAGLLAAALVVFIDFLRRR